MYSKHNKTRKKKKKTQKKIKLQQDSDDMVEPPDDYLCPISYKLMEEPIIVTQSGWTYERTEIEHWIKKNGTDPNTRQECTVNDLIPNRTLRDAIERWKEDNNI